MIRRDRNHPCITMWGLLNETSDGPVFRHAVSVLPELRKLDDSRVVMLNSGRFDNAGGTVGIQVWRNNDRTDPCVTRNGTDHVVKALGITWQPGQIAFHPGRDGEYAVVRWTAPANERVAIHGRLQESIAEAATTDLHVLHNGKPLFDGPINLEGQGPRSRRSRRRSTSGPAIRSIPSAAGATATTAPTPRRWRSKSSPPRARPGTPKGTSDIRQNPHGAWSYGMLKPARQTRQRDVSRCFPLAVSETAIGSISNPGSTGLGGYPERPASLPARAAHGRSHPDAAHAQRQRQAGVACRSTASAAPSTCCASVRWYEQAGKTEVEDAQLYRSWRDQYLADWQRYRLHEVFARPEDFFTQSLARMAGQRLLGINAIRSNPNVIGHSLTGTLDQGMTAEGVWTTFRELKPGATDALFDAWAPLRWCLFAEPVNVYRKTPVQLGGRAGERGRAGAGRLPGPPAGRRAEPHAGLREDDHGQDRRPQGQARAADGAAGLRRGCRRSMGRRAPIVSWRRSRRVPPPAAKRSVLRRSRPGGDAEGRRRRSC